MRVPLSVTDKNGKFLFSFRPITEALIAQHCSRTIKVKPADFVPEILFDVDQILRGFPDKIATRSYVLKSDAVVWDVLISSAPSEKAHAKLLRKIERLVIAKLTEAPAVLNG